MYIRFDKHAIYRVFPVSPGKPGECIEAPKMKQEVRVNTRSQSLTSSYVDTVIFLRARHSVYSLRPERHTKKFIVVYTCKTSLKYSYLHDRFENSETHVRNLCLPSACSLTVITTFESRVRNFCSCNI
mgnify:CR=1 FL=1